MRRIWIGAAVALALAVVYCPFPALGDVVINELLADPARDWSPSDGDDLANAVDDEWLEIYNTGPDPVDVTGWRLRDAISDSSWKYGFDGILYAGDFMIVYGNEAYEWEEQNGYLKNGLGMNNSGDTMTLVRADLTTVADTCTYTGSQVVDDRSYGRLPDGGLEWVVFDELNPMNPPATGLPPTPGYANSSNPVEAVGWGMIKALYREQAGG